MGDSSGVSFQANVLYRAGQLNVDSVASYGLMNGGTAGLIWMYFISWIGFLCVNTSMAEMGSMWVPRGYTTNMLWETNSLLQGAHFRRPVPLGFRVRSKEISEIQQLHHWCACCSYISFFRYLIGTQVGSVSSAGRREPQIPPF
jgi:hypothetical protein